MLTRIVRFIRIELAKWLLPSGFAVVIELHDRETGEVKHLGFTVDISHETPDDRGE